MSESKAVLAALARLNRYGDGPADSMAFELHLYNSSTMQKRVCAPCDFQAFAGRASVDTVRKKADGIHARQVRRVRHRRA